MSLYSYHTLRYYSPVHDTEVERISSYGADGYERHIIVPIGTAGKERRRMRALAVEQLEHLRNSAPPGEVAIDYTENA